ncbi:MAG: hypothetical protein IPG90_07365 [Bacteroidetes bacterium]|nr:hypothetical protein [Bacteroidota bacterium]MBK9543832.1 hypothetical protein [Bacteroidota bacterium]MBL0256692.1 hypothetical protein [Bacteroidota bacterium]
MKRIISCIVFLLIVSAANAQLYVFGLGVRAGKFNTGVSIKSFFNADNATGLLLDGYYTNIASKGYTVKAILIKQLPFKMPIVQIPLDFIYGGGIHGAYFPYNKQGYYKRRNGEPVYYDKSVVTAGVDATIQIEYQVKKIAPFTIGIDVVPYYEFYNPGPEWIDFGVTVRYVFR